MDEALIYITNDSKNVAVKFTGEACESVRN